MRGYGTGACCALRWNFRSQRQQISLSNSSWQLWLRNTCAQSRLQHTWVWTNRNRGCDAHVDLTDSQRTVKRKVYASSAAHMFAELNELAANGRTFLVRQEDGTSKRLVLHIRIIFWVADFEEKMKLLAITSNACPRCLHLHEGLLPRRLPMVVREPALGLVCVLILVAGSTRRERHSGPCPSKQPCSKLVDCQAKKLRRV